MKKFVIRFIILFLFITGMANQTVFGFSITPGRIYKKIKLGEKIKGEYVLSNNENTLLEFSVTRTGGEGWFILPDTMITLKPGESARIPYEIFSSDTNLKGEQKASITISQIPQKQEKSAGSGAAFQTRMTFPVYIFVRNTEKLDYHIEQLEAEADFFKKETDISGRAGMKIRLVNTGNVHFFCEPRLMLYKKGGNGKKELVQEKQEFHSLLVFPSEKKNLTMEINRSLEPGDYILRAFLYFKFDEDIFFDSDEQLKKEKVFSKTKSFRLDREGNTLVEK